MGNKNNQKHGLSESPEYNIWTGMKQRCSNQKLPGFADYGGRGITVCDRWKNSFDAFYADMGPRPSPKHSIDRIDNNGNYEPSNCRWATVTDQARNTRANRNVTAFGSTKTVSEWAAERGVNRTVLHRRLERGELPEFALTTPVTPPPRSKNEPIRGLPGRASDVLRFIREFVDKVGVAPTLREICEGVGCEGVGVSSTNGVALHIEKLTERGFLDLPESVAARSIRLVEPAPDFGTATPEETAIVCALASLSADRARAVVAIANRQRVLRLYQEAS